MADDLNTSIDFLKKRVDATLSIQKQLAETWVWPLRTVAEWEADSLQLDKTQPDTVAAQAIDAATKADSARGVLDGRLSQIHKQTLTAVGVMRVRAERNPELLPVVSALSASGDNRKEIEDEGTELLSAWKEEFGTDFTPGPGLTFNGFKVLFFGDATATPAVPSLRELKQGLSDAATVERSKVGKLNALLGRAQRDAQDWYAEATSVFPANMESGDLVRTIPTTTDYNPPTPASTPAAKNPAKTP
jgi:hypothetical protein